MNKATLSADELAKLSQVSVSEIDDWRRRGDEQAVWPADINSFGLNLYSYQDALAIEIARQLSDDSGISSGPSVFEGLRFVSYTGAVPFYLEHQAAQLRSDFWVGILSARNSWGLEPRTKSFPVTNFGPSEYWSSMRFTGPFDQVTRDIGQAITADASLYPDCDPGRIFMANISAADRRLRKRAAALGVNLDAA